MAAACPASFIDMSGITKSLQTTLKMLWFSLAILTTLLVCIEAFAFGYYFVRRTLSGSDRAEAFIKTQVAKMPRDGYPNPADQTWFAPYWKEFDKSTYGSEEWVSYSNWHRHAFTGQYINVDHDGRRVTWNQESKDPSGLVKIALFGGATIWGTGARDEFTIPSYVSKILAEKYPHRFKVVNHGQDAYVSTQEVIALLREIQNDRIPDIVVFYDGFNDIAASVLPRSAGIPLNEDDRIREFNILHPARTHDFYFELLSRTNTFQLLQGLRRALWPETLADTSTNTDNQVLASADIRLYLRNVQFATALGREFGFATEFFWQPSVYTKIHATGVETSIIRSSGSFAALYRRAHQAMREVQRTAASSHVRDISNALDRYAGTAFIDTSHTTELANEVVAREIVDDLKDILDHSATRVAH
jgi:hypothetical protein